jgi:hypothetical protein
MGIGSHKSLMGINSQKLIIGVDSQKLVMGIDNWKWVVKNLSFYKKSFWLLTSSSSQFMITFSWSLLKSINKS